MADLCTVIGNEASDAQGFVAIRSLLTRFQAELIARPLLVEGMLATVDAPSAGQNAAARWAVLIDSERFTLADFALAQESSDNPLPVRLRNTVAHELVHSLAFQPTPQGLQLKGHAWKADDLADRVASIEQETEKLSPLLLWSEKAMAELLNARRSAIAADDLVQVSRSLGISRPSLINRLNLLSPTDANGFLYLAALQNVAVGIAEWAAGGTAVVKRWPLFLNFQRNIAPSFLLIPRSQQSVSATSFCSDNEFAMCGGRRPSTEMIVDAGTLAVPLAGKMTVELTVEEVPRRMGAEFLIVARGRDTELKTSAGITR